MLTYIRNQSTVRRIITPHDDETPKRRHSLEQIRPWMVPSFQFGWRLCRWRRQILYRVAFPSTFRIRESQAACTARTSDLCILRFGDIARYVLKFDGLLEAG